MKAINESKPKFKFSVLVSIDVSGAFDNVSWKHILNNLSKSNIEDQFLLVAESLLVGRKIFINSKAYKTSKGCPQVGCASPSLWTIGMNNLLNNIEKLIT